MSVLSAIFKDTKLWSLTFVQSFEKLNISISAVIWETLTAQVPIKAYSLRLIVNEPFVHFILIKKKGNASKCANEFPKGTP